MDYKGGCHCGAIRFEVKLELNQAISCNCSICSMRGYILAFTPEQNFKLVTGESQLVDYQFGKKTIHHYFCVRCGTAPFGQGTAPDGQRMRAINIRCLDEVDLGKVPTRAFDGKSL
ncbi:MAG: GFA family protein [Bdellovibrionales bacterium]